MFVHIIMVPVFLCLCMLCNLTLGYTSSWYFALYISCAYIIPPLRHFYIYVCINMVVKVIYIVTEICLCTSYNPLPGGVTYWESFHAYFLYILCHSIVVILVDLHSQKWINTLLFELVVTCIKTHIFASNLSISHICISIIKFSDVSDS